MFFNQPIIYLAYSSSDRIGIEHLYRFLTDHHFKCFFDKSPESGIAVATSHADHIRENINSSHCLIAFISTNSLDRATFVKREWVTAIQKEKKYLNGRKTDNKATLAQDKFFILKVQIDDKVTLSKLRERYRYFAKGSVIKYTEHESGKKALLDTIKIEFNIPRIKLISRNLLRWRFDILIGDRSFRLVITSYSIFMFGVICIDGRNTFHLNALKFNKIFPVVISHPTPGAVQLQAMVKFEPWTATIQDVQFKYQNIELN